MTVSVNAVSRPASDMDQLSQAVGLAMKFYDLKLNADQQKAANGLLAKKAEEDARKEGAKFGGDHEAVTSRPEAGPFVPIDQAPRFARESAPEGSVGYVPASFGQKNRELAIQEDNLNFQRGEKQKERLAGIQNEFEKKDGYQNAKIKLESAQEINALLNTGSPISENIAKTKVARIANGVGVLTDKDVDRVGGSQDVISNAKRVFERANTGKMLAEDVRDLKEITRVFEAIAKENLKLEAERFAKQKSSYVNMTQQQIIESLNIQPLLNQQINTANQNNQNNGGLSAEQIAAREIMEERMRAKQTGGRTR